MYIIGLIALGLFFLTLCIYRIVFIIPAIFIGYYVLVTKVPDFFGYAVDEKHVIGREAMVLSVFDTYFLVLFSGEEEPRLIRVVMNEDAQKAARDAKNKRVVVRFGAKGDEQGKGGNSNSNSDGSVKLVPLEQSEMFSK